MQLIFPPSLQTQALRKVDRDQWVCAGGTTCVNACVQYSMCSCMCEAKWSPTWQNLQDRPNEKPVGGQVQISDRMRRQRNRAARLDWVHSSISHCPYNKEHKRISSCFWSFISDETFRAAQLWKCKEMKAILRPPGSVTDVRSLFDASQNNCMKASKNPRRK